MPNASMGESFSKASALPSSDPQTVVTCIVYLLVSLCSWLQAVARAILPSFAKILSSGQLSEYLKRGGSTLAPVLQSLASDSIKWYRTSSAEAVKIQERTLYTSEHAVKLGITLPGFNLNFAYDTASKPYAQHGRLLSAPISALSEFEGGAGDTTLRAKHSRESSIASSVVTSEDEEVDSPAANRHTTSTFGASSRHAAKQSRMAATPARAASRLRSLAPSFALPRTVSFDTAMWAAGRLYGWKGPK